MKKWKGNCVLVIVILVIVAFVMGCKARTDDPLRLLVEPDKTPQQWTQCLNAGQFRLTRQDNAGTVACTAAQTELLWEWSYLLTPSLPEDNQLPPTILKASSIAAAGDFRVMQPTILADCLEHRAFLRIDLPAAAVIATLQETGWKRASSLPTRSGFNVRNADRIMGAPGDSLELMEWVYILPGDDAAPVSSMLWHQTDLSRMNTLPRQDGPLSTRRGDNGR